MKAIIKKWLDRQYLKLCDCDGMCNLCYIKRCNIYPKITKDE